MKVYRLDAQGEDGHYVRWASTRTEVREKRIDLQDIGCECITVSRIEFPTEQAAIVRWLNAHLSMDNG